MVHIILEEKLRYALVKVKVKVKVIVSYERCVLKLHLTINKAIKTIKQYS